MPSTGDENQYVGKVDWAQSAKHRVFGRYFITDYADPAVFTNNVLTAARPGVVDRAQSMVLGDTYSLTNSMVNGFHARVSRTRVNRGEPENMINPKTLGDQHQPPGAESHRYDGERRVHPGLRHVRSGALHDQLLSGG